VLLDRDQLLLPDEAVPAAERLSIGCGISIIGGHVCAHDLGGVFRDFEPGAESILRLHPGNRFGIDPLPGSSTINGFVGEGNSLGIGHSSLHGDGVRPGYRHQAGGCSKTYKHFCACAGFCRNLFAML
jgi:hypothetical protein